MSTVGRVADFVAPQRQLEVELFPHQLRVICQLPNQIPLPVFVSGFVPAVARFQAAVLVFQNDLPFR